MQPDRLSSGGRIDRSKPLRVTFDGRSYRGFEGDTLASVLLANGAGIVGRSFKYHRPRGVFSAGVEEPNALVRLRDGAWQEPNARATQVEAYDGLDCTGQNAWPNVRFDVGAVNRFLSPFIGAGFYYKTFIGPGRGTRFWMACESFIRKAAGMGRAVKIDDADAYEKVNAHCDVLVVGGGPAGLAAALAAARSGARVILVEQDRELGGSLLSRPAGSATDEWLSEAVSELTARDNVRILTRTTAFGAYDNEVFGFVERVWDHVLQPPAHQPRQRYWQVRTKGTVLATGAIERPLVFGGNDRPGVMLAGAIATYLHRYGVRVGRRVVLCTNNDSAYAVAKALAEVGTEVTLCDLRPEVPEKLSGPAVAAGAKVLSGHGILEARGWRNVTAARIAPVGAEGRQTGAEFTVPCDVIGISAGFAPAVHLWSQRAKKPLYDTEKACFVPDTNQLPSIRCAGDVRASGDLAAAVDQGFEVGAKAAQDAGFSGTVGVAKPIGPTPFATDWTRRILPVWSVARSDGSTQGKAFIDLQHDVARSDIDLAHREGYVSVEHLKRYTTTGMATDQGKLSNVNALARMAELRSVTLPEVGTTTFRPPYTPLAIGALVGREEGRHFRATRLSPIHDWHVADGARLTEAGAWMRPWYYPRGNEDLRSAYIREAAHVREHVGMIDVSTLGKIAVQGPDAAEFLNRVYVNGWKGLQIGRIRYGVMLREDGFVMDDGATARLGETDYFMTTTTANAARVLAFLEHLLQTAWRDLKVHVTSVTDQWAAIAVAGPKSRALLQSVAPACDLSAEALPNNGLVHAAIGDIPVRIHRMSYSGELAYELYTPSGFGHALWRTLAEAGADFDLKPYGTEAMGALRIEKGHVAGPELDGRTTLKDLGLERFASRKKPFVGSVLRHRERLDDVARPSLVGLQFDGEKPALAGSLIYRADQAAKGHGDGHVTSTTYSPALDRNIGLALLANGPERFGESVQVVDFVGGTEHRATVVSPHFFDPEGVRQNA